MTGTIWLIVEGQNDADIVRAILGRHHPHVRIRPLSPTGNNPNLSRLAEQIESLIKQAIQNRQSGDCVAVLHDADLLTRPNDRADYQHIQRVCERYRRDVRLVIARDAIESWLLADVGFCRWLRIRPQNCDTMRQPKQRLIATLDSKSKPKYSIENLSKLLRYVSGETLSPSLQVELDYLVNTACVK